MTRLIRTLLFICVFWLSTLAQITEIKLTIANSRPFDWFGESVAIHGDYILIGASGAWSRGEDGGAAYVFERQGDTWIEHTKLFALERREDLAFGASVDIWGDYIVVGSPWDDGNEPVSGSAYVFRLDDGIWILHDRLIASDGAKSDQFGRSVSIQGNYALIGASFADANGVKSGAAYIFELEGKSWIEKAKLLAADAATIDYFGHSVSLDADYALIGAHRDDEMGDNSGSAYVFRRIGENWVEEYKLLPSDGEASDEFGYSVSISGNYALIGALFDDDIGSTSGAAYVFQRDGESWIQQAKLYAPDAESGALFGRSVAIRSKRAIVGSGAFAKHTHVFQRSNDNWFHVAGLKPSGSSYQSDYGSSVALSESEAVVGASGFVPNNVNGSAYVFSDFLPAVSVGITIDPIYHVIPATGDTIPYTLSFSNNSSDTLTIQAGTRLQYPDSLPAEPIGRTIEFELPPFNAVTVQRLVEVASHFPPGEYSLAVLFLAEPGGETGKVAAQFTKTGAPPSVVRPIPNQYVDEGFTSYVVADLDTVFEDPDSDTLSYFAESDGNTIVSIKENQLYLMSVPGVSETSEIFVTATDEQPASVADTFLVFLDPSVGITNDENQLPNTIALRAAYPNPFNPSTTIRYQLPARQHVKLVIYDMLGRKVRTLLNTSIEAGYHNVKWDGTNLSGVDVASGIYLYRLTVGTSAVSESSFVETRKMLLAR